MSKEVVLNTIQQVFRGQESLKSTVGTEIARLVFLMRNWKAKVLTIEGATDIEIERKIVEWIREMEVIFSGKMTKINTLSGFGGYSLVQLSIGKGVDEKAYLEAYTETIKVLSNKDLTKSRMLARGLQGNFNKGQWKQFYETYDDFIKEAQALGLTSKEIQEKFLNTSFFNSKVNFKDSVGRTWKPENYSHMWARTRSSEIEDELVQDEMTANGMDIVQVSSHNTQTPICQQFEGRFFSLNGETQNIPILEIKPPFHPNCLHRLLPKARVKEDTMINTNRALNKKLVSSKKKWPKGARKAINRQETWNKLNRK